MKPTPREFVPGRQMTADEYREQWIRGQVWTHLERPKQVRRLNWCADHCEGQRFVDVGCMLGHSTAAMAKRHPGDWTGIDFSEKAIDMAWQNFPGIGFRFLRSVADLAGMVERYDTAVCSEVIEHVPDPQELLRGLLAIADRVIITTPRADAQDPSHVRLYTEASLLAEIQTACNGLYWAIQDGDKDFLYVIIWKRGK
jgi:2-polyprenyl-3-methyl-5-hydroxy-6-metoxy-1,4-benzoquinol methylase